jgi:hypothetical protein
MDERPEPDDGKIEQDESGAEATQMRGHAPRVVFAVVSVGFLLYLAFGTVEARIWRFGRLYFEDRPIRDVWGYLGDHLPDLPGQGIIGALYWLSLGVMVIGVVLGLWLFLGTDDEDPASDVAFAHQDPTHRDA